MSATTEAEILRKAEYKHIGAEGGQRGYDFQDFVTLIEIVRGGIETPCTDLPLVQIIQNAQGSQVDDLHVVFGARRRHVQIKSDAALSWVKKLRQEFRHDRTLFQDCRKDLTLELCVRSEALAETLRNNRGRHKLGFVQVTSGDIEAMDNFPTRGVLDQLRKLSVAFPSNSASVELWYQLYGTWRWHLKRRGSLQDIFKAAGLATGGAMRSLARPADRTTEVAVALRSIWGDALSVSTDGDTLIIKRPGAIMRATLDQQQSDLADVIEAGPPATVMAMLEAARAFKDEDDDDELF